MPLFAFLMLPEPGHILPTLRLAYSLEAKGHSIVYLCPAYLQAFFVGHGFKAEAIMPQVLTADSIELWSAPAGKLLFESIESYSKRVKTNIVEMLSAELASIPFDILACDSVIAVNCGKALQQALHRPIVSISTYLPDDLHPPTAIPEVVLCPDEVCLPLERLEHRRSSGDRLYAEPSVFGKRVGDYMPHGLQMHERIVYCSFGTQTARYEMWSNVAASVIGAFQKIRAHLLLSCADARGISRSSHLPSNVTVIKSGARQLELLKRSSLCITHGGLGTLKECILSAVPALVIPFDLDQPSNAARVEHHQLGASCTPEDCSSETVGELVTALLDDRVVSSALRHMSDIFWHYEARAPAADFLIRQLQSHP